MAIVASASTTPGKGVAEVDCSFVFRTSSNDSGGEPFHPGNSATIGMVGSTFFDDDSLVINESANGGDSVDGESVSSASPLDMLCRSGDEPSRSESNPENELADKALHDERLQWSFFPKAMQVYPTQRRFHAFADPNA